MHNDNNEYKHKQSYVRPTYYSTEILHHGEHGTLVFGVPEFIHQTAWCIKVHCAPDCNVVVYRV